MILNLLTGIPLASCMTYIHFKLTISFLLSTFSRDRWYFTLTLLLWFYIFSILSHCFLLVQKEQTTYILFWNFQTIKKYFCKMPSMTILFCAVYFLCMQDRGEIRNFKSHCRERETSCNKKVLFPFIVTMHDFELRWNHLFLRFECWEILSLEIENSVCSQDCLRRDCGGGRCHSCLHFMYLFLSGFFFVTVSYYVPVKLSFRHAVIH